MFKKTQISLCAWLVISGACGPVALAQHVQRVEVTGSRVLSPNAESATPLQVITADELAKSGVVNVQDLLLKLPSMGTAAYSRTNTAFLASSAGLATVDLRNLGTSRTLVLVNGRRFVSGLPGSSAVDMNAIPTDFIDRVEVSTGGASVAYGSDAVAGVVNIILKKNFEGLVVDVQKGRSSKGDDNKEKFSLTLGSAGADGKSQLMGHIGFSRQGAVYAKDHGAAVDNASLADTTGLASDIFKFVSPKYSSYTPAGTFWSGGDPEKYFTVDGSGAVVPFSANGDAANGVAATGFNRQAYRMLAVPTDRLMLASKGDFALSDQHSLFFEANYVKTKVKATIEPAAMAAEDIFPSTGGQVPIDFNVGGQLLTNPTISSSLLAKMNDNDGDGLRDYYFLRRMAEVGTRTSVIDRDTARIATGIQGSLPGHWDYDTYLVYGATREVQVSNGGYNVNSVRNALLAIPDVDDRDSDGNTTEAVCLDADAYEQGCVPISLFGAGSISAAGLKYISASSLQTSFITQTVAGGVLRGDVGRLPAGAVNLAIGTEWRKETSRSEFDALTQSGLNGGNALPNSGGHFNVKELFAEGRVPLLKDAVLARSLAVRAGVRLGRYSTVGSTVSWNTGVEWSPIPNVLIRGTRALATRAPSIDELYAPASQTYEPVNDPCEGVTATSTGAGHDRCRADPGVAANIAANGAFTLNAADIEGTNGYNRGNPELKEEKGQTWSWGVVFTPQSPFGAGRMMVSLDHFKIRIQDAIEYNGRQYAVQQCYQGDADFCKLLTRRSDATGAYSAGSIAQVDSVPSNSGGLFTQGVDLAVTDGFKVADGRLAARLSYTYLRSAYTVPAPGADADSFKGEIGAAKHRAMLSLGFERGPWGVSTTTTYIGRSSLDDQYLAGFGAAAGSVTVPSKTYLDLQASYSFGKAQIYAGLDNALNTRAPQFDTNGIISGGTAGAGTAADVYDAIGRRYYVGLRFEL